MASTHTFPFPSLLWRARCVEIARRQPADQVAGDPVDFVGAEFLETLLDRLGPEARRRKPSLVPIPLQPLGERRRAFLAQALCFRELRLRWGFTPAVRSSGFHR